jgi:hypothetical protein
MVDLLVLTSSDQLLLLKRISYKTFNLDEEVNCTESSLSLRVLCLIAPKALVKIKTQRPYSLHFLGNLRMLPIS